MPGTGRQLTAQTRFCNGFVLMLIEFRNSNDVNELKFKMTEMS